MLVSSVMINEDGVWSLNNKDDAVLLASVRTAVVCLFSSVD